MAGFMGSGGGGSGASSDIDGDILDVGEMLGEANDETWLVDTSYNSYGGAGGGGGGVADPGFLISSPLQHEDAAELVANIQSKKSLVNKLDNIARGSSAINNQHQPASTAAAAAAAFQLSPISSVSSGGNRTSSDLSPGMSSYLRQNLSSTPMHATNRVGSRFDPRTFTRPAPKLSMDMSLLSHEINDIASMGNNHTNVQNLTDISFCDVSTPARQQQPPPSLQARLASVTSSANSGGGSPPMTPSSKPLNATFDASATITRRHSSITPPKSVAISNVNNQINSTFDKTAAAANKQLQLLQQQPSLQQQPLNATFDMQSPAALNATYGLLEEESGNHEPLMMSTPAAAAPIKAAINVAAAAAANRTFEVNNSADSSPSGGGGINATFTRNRKMSHPSPSEAAAAAAAAAAALGSSPAGRRFSRDSSHDGGVGGGVGVGVGVVGSGGLLDEDRFSSTSGDSSVSHRLNDVGDVQQLARMQEESLRQPLPVTTSNHHNNMHNNHHNNHHNHRSATISPSSEQSLHSPSTESFSIGGGNNANQAMYNAPGGGGGNNEYRQLKENNRQSRERYQQYSSQDSLPDSPYSSQSLDSQSAQGQDRLRRSMPNLNKIRGRGGSAVGTGRTSGGNPAGGQGGGGGGGGGGIPSAHPHQRPSNSYGLSRHHNSDPRLQQAAASASNSRMGSAASRGYYGGRPSYAGPPSRGSIASNESEGSGQPRVEQTSSSHHPHDSTFRVPNQPPPPQPKLSLGSRLARPVGSGIPRPGSRLPGPTGRSSGIPKPSSSGGSGNGSRPGSRASSVGPRQRATSQQHAASDYYYQ